MPKQSRFAKFQAGIAVILAAVAPPLARYMPRMPAPQDIATVDPVSSPAQVVPGEAAPIPVTMARNASRTLYPELSLDPGALDVPEPKGTYESYVVGGSPSATEGWASGYHGLRVIEAAKLDVDANSIAYFVLVGDALIPVLKSETTYSPPVAMHDQFEIEPSSDPFSVRAIYTSAAERSIDYVDIHTRNPELLIERSWEVFDQYFDTDEIPEDDFRTEQEKFVDGLLGWAFEFTIQGIAYGIAGNLAYDKLKELLAGRRHPSHQGINDRYRKLRDDLNRLLELFEQAERQGQPIRTRDVAQAAGVSQVLARAWLKLFGFRHFSGCTWEPVK